MDWTQFVMLWGPAVPLAVILLRAHWVLVYVTIPESFKKLETFQQSSEEWEQRRHSDHAELIRVLNGWFASNGGKLSGKTKTSAISAATNSKRRAGPARPKRRRKAGN